MKRLLPCSLLLILVWSACHPDLDGTTGPMPATTETSYQTASYLSNQKVTSICEDAEGHIWIGTLRGLNRFDAHEYHQYFCNDHDSTSLPDNQIQHSGCPRQNLDRRQGNHRPAGHTYTPPLSAARRTGPSRPSHASL